MASQLGRYAKTGTHVIDMIGGAKVSVLNLPLARPEALRGLHRRLDGQRLDLIANHYTSDPTSGWRLCDGNGTMCPDALAARDLVGIPKTSG